MKINIFNDWNNLALSRAIYKVFSQDLKGVLTCYLQDPTFWECPDIFQRCQRPSWDFPMGCPENIFNWCHDIKLINSYFGKFGVVEQVRAMPMDESTECQTWVNKYVRTWVKLNYRAVVMGEIWSTFKPEIPCWSSF